MLPGLDRDGLDRLLATLPPADLSRHSRRLARRVARAVLAGHGAG